MDALKAGKEEGMSKQMVETGKCEDPQLASVKEVISSRGVPLDPAVQARLEKQFDRNFDFVRVHLDEHASRSARLLNARAYTVGAHIVFAKGHYNPETQTGQWLLAHELTHVVQQGSGCSVPPLGLSKADHPLEHIADQAADIIAAGCSFPQDFVFGSAPAGVVQCHIVPNDPTHAQCPGYAIGTDATMIQEAERTIEFAYQGAPGVGGLIVYGSNDLQWPEGMLVDRRRTAFVTELLTMLRERPVEQRPNILNFTLREAYFFRRQNTSDADVVRIINAFHQAVDRLARRHRQPTWASAASNWYPVHVLPFIADPGQRFVCTQATIHTPPRGLILFDIRGPRRRRQQRPSEIRMLDFWRAYDQFRQVVRSRLPAVIPVFDPASPDYVIIVPDEFIRNPKIQKMVEANMQPVWDKFRVDSWMSRNRMTLDPRVKIFWLGVVSIVGAAAIVVVTGGLGTPVVAIETGAGAIIVDSALAARVAAGAQAMRGVATAVTATEAISLGAWTATVSAPTVGTMIGMSGVVLVIGFANVAHAGNAPPTLESATAIRVVPINDFIERGGQLYADSSPVVPDSMYTTQQFKEKFSIGTKVFFDNKQHWVLGQIQVR